MEKLTRIKLRLWYMSNNFWGKERERKSKWCECLCVSGTGTDVMEMISTNHLPSESAAYPRYQSGFWSHVLNAFVWKSTLWYAHRHHQQHRHRHHHQNSRHWLNWQTQRHAHINLYNSNGRCFIVVSLINNKRNCVFNFNLSSFLPIHAHAYALSRPHI